MRPKAATVSATTLSQTADRETSASSSAAVPPAASISAFSASPRSALRPTSMTAAPWAANWRAVSAPSPEVAPVISATLSAKASGLKMSSMIVVSPVAVSKVFRRRSGP